MIAVNPSDLSPTAQGRIEEILTTSFPPEELAPVDWLMQSCADGHRRLLVDDPIEPDALMLLVDVDPKVRYLEYFAVHASKRNRGRGSAALRALVGLDTTLDGYIFEVDAPGAGTDADDNRFRERRLGFYQRNGASRSELSALEIPATTEDDSSVTLHMWPMWLPVRSVAAPNRDASVALYEIVLIESYLLSGDQARETLGMALAHPRGIDPVNDL